METANNDALRRFRGALKIPTWWPADALPGDAAAEAPLRCFQEFLEEQYPAFHQRAERWAPNPYSLVYCWRGASSGSASNSAVLFLAHYDVVPAETEKWNSGPFEAELKDGFVYGRGSLDMKNTLIGIMEAAENLCVAGFTPGRDIWFAFGGDEERSGILGAGETANWFARRGQRFAWILDEGTPVAVNQIPGVDTPLALVSIEEKGFLSLELSAVQEPGHASRPPRVQAAAVLGKALTRIARRPFPCKLVPTVERFFREIAPYTKGIQGFVMRHARLFGRAFFAVVSSSPTAMSMLRTTVAMTQLEGSAADNVMPSQARAVINLRLLQPWTVETAKQFIEKIINDRRIQVSIYGLGTGPVPASGSGGGRPGWAEIKTALNEAWPGVPLLPFIMVATTDSRHYHELAGDIFRFSPYRLSPQDMSGIHGHDERISEENFFRGLSFYTKLLETL